MISSSVRDLVREASGIFAQADLPNAHHEAEWLLAHLLGRARVHLYLDNPDVPAATAERFREMCRARARGVPLQYLIGETEFYGARFFVRSGVFIPRPETEAIVQNLYEAIRRRGYDSKPLSVIEFGTGSGCIAVTLARLLPACHVLALEVSYRALTIARKNAEANGVAERVRFVQGRWAEAIRGRADVLVSNPPYVPTPEVERLPLDVRCEPRMSLDGGPDGMRDLSQLILESKRLLGPEGLMALECGEEQVAPLMQLASLQRIFRRIHPISDLAGRGRGVLLERGG